jgi:predicted aspartyl protease
MVAVSRGLVLACVFAVAFGASAAEAQIYRWIDEAGVPHYSEGLDSVPERYRASATSLGLRNAPASPAASEASAQTTPGGVTVIRYAPGQRIMVDVRINGAGSARLVFDTGADRTIISPRALRAAGVSLTRVIATGQVVGVTGSDRLPFVGIDSLDVGEARITQIPVGAYEIAQAEGDGILGRDVLDRFHITIDAARGQVTLAPK